MRFFRSRLDSFNRSLTVVVVLIAVGVPLGVGFLLSRVGSSAWLVAPVGVLANLALIAAWAHRPTGVTVGDEGLAVRRLVGERRWSWSEIAAVELGAAWPPGSLGLFRAGGFFGTYGLFWAKSRGRFEAWTTRRQPLVGLELASGGWALLSVDDAAGLGAEVARVAERRGLAVRVLGEAPRSSN